MDDQLMMGGTPWWRNVNMAKQEEAKAFFLSQRSQKSQKSTTRPASPPPASADTSPSIPAAAPITQTPATARAPVAPFSLYQEV